MSYQTPPGKPASPEPMVPAKTIAAILGITDRSVINHFHADLIPGYRIGKSVRFRISEVLEAIEGANS